jgi:hypothetical protein
VYTTPSLCDGQAKLVYILNDSGIPRLPKRRSLIYVSTPRAQNFKKIIHNSQYIHGACSLSFTVTRLWETSTKFRKNHHNSGNIHFQRVPIHGTPSPWAVVLQFQTKPESFAFLGSSPAILGGPQRNSRKFLSGIQEGSK